MRDINYFWEKEKTIPSPAGSPCSIPLFCPVLTMCSVLSPWRASACGGQWDPPVADGGGGRGAVVVEEWWESSVGGGGGGGSRLPCCVFRFVYLHSRRWEPSIS